MNLKRFYFFLTILLVLTIPVITTGSWHIDNVTVMTAVSTVTGSAVATMNISIRNITDDVAVNQIAWPNIPCPYSGCTENPDTAWKVADQYVRIEYVNNQSGWGIACYTEVTNNDPKYTGGASYITNEIGEWVPSYPSGLVSENGANTLPMIWQPHPDKYEDAGRNDIPPVSDPYNGNFTNGHYWQWKWQSDISTGTFTNLNDGLPTYYAVPVSESGYLRGQAANERDGCNSPVFLYFGADFNSATIQNYKLTTLTLEQYIP